MAQRLDHLRLVGAHEATFQDLDEYGRGAVVPRLVLTEPKNEEGHHVDPEQFGDLGQA